MIKHSVVLLSIFIAGCASTSESNSNETVQQSIAKSEAVITEVASTIETQTPTDIVFINSFSTFSEDAKVATNIQQECHAVAATLSDAVIKYAKEQKITVKGSPDITPEQSGKVIKVSITDMYSGGNAFIGHRKSASVRAELFQDGKLIDKAEYTRNSMGGFLGGFKGSCSVLEHTVNTLGNDVAKWLKRKTG